MATTRSPASPPHSHVRSRRRLAIAAAVLVPLLAGCGAGFQAQTNQIYQPGPGVTVRDSGVYVINALIVTDGEGNGTLVAALINQAARPDTLVGAAVKFRTGRALTTSILSGTIFLPSQHPVQVGFTGDVRVKGLLVPGTFVTLTLTFKNAEPVTVQIPILTRTPEYDSIPVGPVPPPTTPSHSNPSAPHA